MATSKQEVTLYGANGAIIEQKRNNYIVQGVLGGTPQTLVRDVDFGKIPKTKQPSLYKAGAEKICLAYGVFQRYDIESKIETLEPNPSFTYVIKCSLIKINPVDGKEWVVATGFGAASTNEKRNGYNGAFDALNSTVKMAEKRSLVSAAISLGGISGAFTQDIEADNFMEQSNKLQQVEGDDAPINAKQTKRIFALAASNGYSTEEAKNKLKGAGFASTKDVKVKDYDRVCALFEEKK